MSRILKTKNNLVTYRYGGSHKGIDIVGNGYALDDIIAHSDGIVVDCRNTYTSCDEKTGASYGNFVELDHGQGYHTIYAHMKAGSVNVTKGQQIKKGTVLGYMWNSGRSNGKHLHFEVKKEGVKIDPTPYIDADLPLVHPIKDKIYTLHTDVKGYMNATNASKRINSVATYTKGTYYIFYESMGMINITKTKGVAGAWINPTDNQEVEYINIPPTLETCRVYPLNQEAIVGNEIGKLAPKRYGGLSYRVLKKRSEKVVEIKTNSFGQVQIYVGIENGLSITKQPKYTTEYDRG